MYDALQSPELQTGKTMALSECCTLGASLGFGRGSVSLEEEVRACLLFFNSLGFVMYFDEEGLRDLVILNPVAFLIDPITKVAAPCRPAWPPLALAHSAWSYRHGRCPLLRRRRLLILFLDDS